MPWTEHEPNTTVVKHLLADWGDFSMLTMDVPAWYDPDAVAHFDTAWIHTGWYDDDNPHPQITATTISETPQGDAIDGAGRGPVSWMNTQVGVNVWVPDDTEYTGGQNPKQYFFELRTEVARIIHEHYGGGEDLSWMQGAGGNMLPTRDESPVEHRWELTVDCGWRKHR